MRRAWSSDGHPSTAARRLGHYLHVGDPSSLGFFLTAPDEALKTHGIRKAEIEEAAELLRKRRGAPEKRLAFEVSLPSADPEPEPQPSAPASTSEQARTGSPPSSSSSGQLQRPIKQPPSRPSNSTRGDEATAVLLAPPSEKVTFGEPTPLVVLPPSRPEVSRAGRTLGRGSPARPACPATAPIGLVVIRVPTT